MVGDAIPSWSRVEGATEWSLSKLDLIARPIVSPQLNGQKDPAISPLTSKKKLKRITSNWTLWRPRSETLAKKLNENHWPLTVIWTKTLLLPGLYWAVGEGFFCLLRVAQQKKLMIAQAMKIRIWTPNPEAIAFSLFNPAIRNPAAHPASSVPQFPNPLIGTALAIRPTEEPKTTLRKDVSIPNPLKKA